MEAGFELDEQQAALVQRMALAEDIRGLLGLFDDVVRARPRDPFPRLTRNGLRALIDADDAGAKLRHARDCLDAASLVPEGEIYDEYRTLCVTYAGVLTLQARNGEVMRHVNVSGSTPASQFAVSCFDWLQTNGPKDATGEIGECRAWSLLSDGQLDAALVQADKVRERRKGDPEFAYGYACLMSRRNNADKALEWLLRAINQGYSNIVHIKSDPDLMTLRVQRHEEYTQAVTVKWEWKITWGVFKDDITVTNIPLAETRPGTARG